MGLRSWWKSLFETDFDYEPSDFYVPGRYMIDEDEGKPATEGTLTIESGKPFSVSIYKDDGKDVTPIATLEPVVPADCESDPNTQAAGHPLDAFAKLYALTWDNGDVRIYRTIGHVRSAITQMGLPPSGIEAWKSEMRWQDAAKEVVKPNG